MIDILVRYGQPPVKYIFFIYVFDGSMKASI